MFKQRDIVKYLLTNPEQCCCVLDGYDEFHHKLRKQEAKKEQLDSENPLPVSDLISGLLNRQLLPGSTVLVTCRARDVVDLESVSDKIGQLLVWSRHQISEYVNNYFGKGKDLVICGILLSAGLTLVLQGYVWEV